MGKPCKCQPRWNEIHAKCFSILTHRKTTREKLGVDSSISSFPLNFTCLLTPLCLLDKTDQFLSLSLSLSCFHTPFESFINTTEPPTQPQQGRPAVSPILPLSALLLLSTSLKLHKHSATALPVCLFPLTPQSLPYNQYCPEEVEEEKENQEFHLPLWVSHRKRPVKSSERQLYACYSVS